VIRLSFVREACVDRAARGEVVAPAAERTASGTRRAAEEAHLKEEIPLLRKRIRRRALAAAACLAVGVGLFALAPITGGASSHREAPLTAADPQIDTTDVWAFVSEDRPSTVTIIASWIPFQEPAGGPNFYAWADGVRYSVNVDNDHDAKPNLVYHWVFSNHYRNENTFLYNTGQVTSLNDPDLNFYQTYDLVRVNRDSGRRTTLVNDAVAAPSHVGAASMPNYNADLFNAATVQFGGGESRTWAGQSDDAFFLDLRVFDLLYGADLSEVGDDTLAGFNVSTIALQVPKDDLALGRDAEANPIVGIWSATSRRSIRIQRPNGSTGTGGRFVQVSRLGMPLVNEVVIPVGLKDYFNSSKPSADGAALPLVQDPELPHLLNAIYGTAIPDSDPDTAGVQRADLVSVFLTGVDGLNMPADVTPSEQIRLNMSIPPCSTECSPLGVIDGDLAGFPNGRRLQDDIIDVSLRVVLGVLLPDHEPIAETIGDGVGANDVPFNASFPYVGFPHAGSDPDPH
jgi:hypothetical protein